MKNSKKSPKIFISHKYEDKPFVKELTKLIEFVIGADPEKIFCSSIGGYDIKPSGEILKELKSQFKKYEVIFIVVHSPRYYNSAICLNEMGAAWILGTEFYSFLTPDCEGGMLKGVIDKKYVYVKVNEDIDQVISKLNFIKDRLVEAFSIKGINNTRWEEVRNQFIDNTKIKIYNGNNENSVAKDGVNAPEPEANITARCIKSDYTHIIIGNQGKSEARNLIVKFDEKCEGMPIYDMELFPLDYLRPEKEIQLTIYPRPCDPTKFKIYFEWDENETHYKTEDLIVL